MNKNEITKSLHSQNDPAKVQFYINGNPVTNRFDVLAKSENEIDTNSKISYYLYSLISRAIIYKAQGKEKAKEGENYLLAYFKKIETKTPEEFKNNIKAEVIKAQMVLADFLYGIKKVELAHIIASFAPIVIMDVALQVNPIADRKTFLSFDKNRQTIFNLTLFYIRSLFHSFLTLESTDPMLIKTDVDNPTNGLFTYGTSLVIPTGRNAFTLDGYKNVIEAGLERISSNFSISDTMNIIVIYLVKDLLAEMKL
ncbi:MAG: hypothetical protein WCR67_05330 [Bacilli bacterium]